MSVCNVYYLECLQYSKIPTSSLKPHPHLVWVQLQTGDGNITYCVGTLISERFVLTSIECVDSDLGVIVGKSKVFFSPDDHYGIVEIHKNYIEDPFQPKSTNYRSNALIKLVRDVPLDAFHRPACIWTNNVNPDQGGLVVEWLGENEKNYRYGINKYLNLFLS